MSIRIYTEQYAGLLPDIYAVKAHFMPTFGGGLQVRNGVEYNENFINLKTIDTDVTIKPYSTDANVAFGTGTGNTSRFGERIEIKAVDTTIPYDAPLAIHEGVDYATVNANFDSVVAERLAKHAEAWTEHLNGVMAEALSVNASETLAGDLTADGVAKAFNDANVALTNNKVDTTLTRRAYVTPEVYNIIMDSPLTTTAKNSDTNIDTGSVVMFKGFVIEVLADAYFQAGENILFAVDNVGVIGIGLELARTIDSEDFAGVALQGLAKYAKFIPEKNKIGILKATLTAPL